MPCARCLLVIIAGAFVSSCASKSERWGFGDCQGDKSPRPDWVSKLEKQEPGYVFGVGTVDYDDQEGPTAAGMVERAQAAANVNLVESQLEVWVKSEVSQEMHSQGNDVQVNARSYVQSRTDARLPGLKLVEKWQDPDSCAMHALVKLPARDIVALRTQARADYYLDRVKNEKLSRQERLHSAGEALGFLQEADFSSLPNSRTAEDYRLEFRQLHDVLQAQGQGRQNAVYFIGDENLTAPIKERLLRELGNQIPGSFIAGASCTSLYDCINLSLKDNIPYTTVLQVSLELSKDKGFWIGPFAIDISVWDSQQKKPYNKLGPLTVNVMNLQKYLITPDTALDKWLTAHQPKISQIKVN